MSSHTKSTWEWGVNAPTELCWEALIGRLEDPRWELARLCSFRELVEQNKRENESGWFLLNPESAIDFSISIEKWTLATARHFPRE